MTLLTLINFNKLYLANLITHFSGMQSGKYLELRSSLNSDTSGELSGPTLEPSNNCRIRFWYSMEGNSTNNGKLYLLYVTVNQSPNFILPHWATEPEQFPTLTFGFNRVEVTIGRMSGTTRLFFRGNKGTKCNFKLVNLCII